MKRLYIGVLWMVFSLSILQAKEIKMSSPDEKYQFTLSDEGGNLHYSLNWNAKETIKPSLLGIKANTIWRDHLSLGDMTTAEQDTVWHPVYGERSTIKDQYKAWSVVINRQNSRDKLVLDIRAYNEGIAFRYRFPGGQYLKITDEFTEYTLPEGTKAYFTSRAQTPYEFLPLEGWPGESDRPLLLTLPEGPYVCLAEAQVVDYVRTKFKLSTEKKNTIQSAMYGPVEDIAPYHTPWRVIMCADKPGQILEHNDLILNLNPSCKIKDTSWIKPGKVVREVTLTTEGGKALVDFAVKRNLQYIHFDAGWYGFEYDKVSDATTVTLDPRRNPDINALNLKEVVAYAKERGIGVILYVNQRALQQQLDEILPLYKSWGIAGIKFGFVQVGSQVWTKWMHEAIKKCADYGLMVDVHDEYRPTGFSRTYPNLIGNESARGTEYQAFGGSKTFHTTVLPFTRLQGGPMDYTPGIFEMNISKLNPNNSSHVNATLANQLALYVTMYSPLQMAADLPENYERFMDAFQFIKDVPVDWDNSIYLEAEPGKYVTVARKEKGTNNWFIGSATGDANHQSVISLDFLEKGKNYIATIYADTKDTDYKSNPQSYQIVKGLVNSKNKLKINTVEAGGYAISLFEVTTSDEMKGLKKLSVSPIK